jgi:peptidoglycan/LPS O-acetylase OafA/YrhL
VRRARTDSDGLRPTQAAAPAGAVPDAGRAPSTGGAPAAAPGASRRLDSIDILKALAIAGVIVQHGLPGADRREIFEALHLGQAVPVFIILTGVNLAMAAARRGHRTLGELASRSYVQSRLARLLGPLAVLWIVSLAVGLLEHDLYLGLLTPFGALPFHGPGNYYIPIAFEFVALFPFAYWAFVRWPRATLVAFVVVDAGFEVLANHVLHTQTRVSPGAASYLYDVCGLRYLAVFALGLWLSVDAGLTARRNGWVLAAGAAGAVYVVLEDLRWRTFPLFEPGFERRTNVLAAGYAACLVMVGLRFLPALAGGRWSRGLAAVGRASYHIFLVQILWFGLFPDLSVAATLIALAVCIPAGIAYQRLVPGGVVGRRVRAAA